MPSGKSIAVYVVTLILGLSVGHAAPRLFHMLEKRYQEGDYTALYPDRDTRVVVFGTQGCSFCKHARDYFDQRHVTYVFEDVQASARAAEKLAKFGTDGIPVVIIGNRRIQGFWPEEYAAALSAMSN